MFSIQMESSQSRGLGMWVELWSQQTFSQHSRGENSNTQMKPWAVYDARGLVHCL